MWFVNGTPYANKQSAEEAADRLAWAGIKVVIELDSCGGPARGGKNGVTVSHGRQPRAAEQDVRPVASHDTE